MMTIDRTSVVKHRSGHSVGADIHVHVVRDLSTISFVHAEQHEMVSLAGRVCAAAKATCSHILMLQASVPAPIAPLSNEEASRS
jgi:hypothetical protein